MGGIKINDLGLLRYCQAAIGGDIDEIKDAFPADKYVCFGEYRSDGEPLWVVALYNFKHQHNCEIDITLNPKGIFTTSIFSRMGRVVFNYIFDQAKLERATVKVRESNEKSIRLAKAWGFIKEGFIRKGYSKPNIENMVILGILRSECRWI